MIYDYVYIIFLDFELSQFLFLFLYFIGFSVLHSDAPTIFFNFFL